nr:unnamed protein product [Callosobruchus chinensis]
MRAIVPMISQYDSCSASGSQSRLIKMGNPGESLRGRFRLFYYSCAAPARGYLNTIAHTLYYWFQLENFAKLRVFVLVLLACEFFQELLLVYFRRNAKIWGEHYGNPMDHVGWFIYTSEVYAGIFALGLAYWGNRTNRASWIGGLTIFLAVAAATLAIPEIYKPYNATEIDRPITEYTCKENVTHTIVGKPRKHFTLDANFILVQIFQVFAGVASTAYRALGISYIVNHIKPHQTSRYIAFFGSLGRIMENKFLLLNVITYTLIQSAMINFRLIEQAYTQSKYRTSSERAAIMFKSGLNQFTSYLIEQPIVAVISVACGFLLTKVQRWGNQTTYIKFEDSCIHRNSCQVVYALSQVNSASIYALMASVVMCNTVINIRSVERRDVPAAVGVIYTCIGLIPYLFIRCIYLFSADGLFCLIEGENGCQYYSAGLSTFISTLTAALIFLALVMSVVVLHKLKSIQEQQIHDESNPKRKTSIAFIHPPVLRDTGREAMCYDNVVELETLPGPSGLTTRDSNEGAVVAETQLNNEGHQSTSSTSEGDFSDSKANH